MNKDYYQGNEIIFMMIKYILDQIAIWYLIYYLRNKRALTIKNEKIHILIYFHLSLYILSIYKSFDDM